MGARGSRGAGAGARPRLALVLALACCWTAAPARAAPGDLDPSFSHDGKQGASIGPGPSTIEAVAVDAAGRILLAGSVGAPTVNAQDIAVARLLPDGSPDASFDGDGVTRLDFGVNETATAVAAGAGGDVYLTGPSGPTAGNQLVAFRLREDGSLDPAFGGDGIAATTVDGANAVASDLAVTGEGGVVVAGRAHDAAEGDVALARFDPDGSLDPTFGGDGTVRSDLGGRESGHAVTFDDDGRLVVGGSRGGASLVARYAPDGSLDPSFSQDGYDASTTVGGTVTELAVGADGAILIGGRGGVHMNFDRYWTSFVAAYTDTGQVAFTPPPGTTDGLRLAGIEADHAGRFVVAYTIDYCPYRGGCSPLDFILDRYLESGSIDPEFGSGDRRAVRTDFGRTDDYAEALAIAPDGRIVLAGTSSDRLAVARYLDDAGPRDADADGILAGTDLCERSYAPQEPTGCERPPRTISIEASDRHGRKHRFGLKGSIEAPWRECYRNVAVSVFRMRKGPDTLVGTDVSSPGGLYFLKPLRRTGRYYARIPNVPYPTGMCARARSEIVGVARPRREGSR